jgi:hypothetical protein
MAGTPSKAAHVDARSQPSHPTVVEFHCCPPLIKVSIIKISSSLWCRRANPHWKPWAIVPIEASPMSSDGGAAGRPVLGRHRLVIYSQLSISWPPVQIRLGIPLHSDWILAIKSRDQRPPFNESHGPVDHAAVDPVYGPWTYSTRLFFTKIIHKIWKSWRLVILQKCP